ncbi:unnamed protein product, partial [Discosporangium mesarthrocarpum]
TLGKVFKLANRWREAVGLLYQMRAEGVQPNSICYNTAIGACAEAGRRLDHMRGRDGGDMALQLLDEMHKVGLEPDVISYR